MIHRLTCKNGAVRAAGAPRRAGRGPVAPLKCSTPHERCPRGANRACFGTTLHGPAAGQGRGGAEAAAESEEVEGLGEAVLPRQGRPARPGLRRGLRSARRGSQHECFVLEPNPRRARSFSACISATRSKVEDRKVEESGRVGNSLYEVIQYTFSHSLRAGLGAPKGEMQRGGAKMSGLSKWRRDSPAQSRATSAASSRVAAAARLRRCRAAAEPPPAPRGSAAP